ncbi:MAG: DUF2892 domain-containing protein [Elusimicrobiota bacterium]
MTTIAHHRHKRNVGDWERGVRLFVGTAVAGVALTPDPIWLRVILGLIAAESLATSVSGYSPINRAAGRDSYHHKSL